MPNTNFLDEFENFKVFLQNLKVKNKTLYWFDKPIISKNDTGGTLIGTPYTAGGNLVRVLDGGTGLNGIPRDHIFIASDDNTLTTMKVGSVMKRLMGSDNIQDFSSNNTGTGEITGVKEITLAVPVDDPAFIPKISSNYKFDISAAHDLNVTSEETAKIKGKKIRLEGTDNVTVVSKEILQTADRSVLDVTNATNKKQAGFLIKDLINSNNVPNIPTSTLTLAGTLGIVPTVYTFTNTTKSIQLSSVGNPKKNSSIVVLEGVSSSTDYTIDDLVLTLEDPETVDGQLLIIKSNVNQKVTLRILNSRLFDGTDTELTLDKKLQSVILFAGTGKWMNVSKLDLDNVTVDIATETKAGTVYVYNPDVPKPAGVEFGTVTDLNFQKTAKKLLKTPKTDPSNVQGIKVTYNEYGIVVGHDALTADDLPEHTHNNTGEGTGEKRLKTYSANIGSATTTSNSTTITVPDVVKTGLFAIFASGVKLRTTQYTPHATNNTITLNIVTDQQTPIEILYHE